VESRADEIEFIKRKYAGHLKNSNKENRKIQVNQ